MTARAFARRAGPSAAWRPRSIEGIELDLNTSVLVPGVCACCMAPASRSRALHRHGEAAMIVPYCADCHAHAAAFSTRVLAVALASGLLGLTLSLSLPFVSPWLSLGATTAIAAAGASGPLLFAVLVGGRPRQGHAVSWRAVWWVERDKLFCAEPRFAAALDAGCQQRPAMRREPALTLFMFLGLIATLVVAPPLHRLHHPLVRIVNLSPQRLSVCVDGRPVSWVEPTSAESSAAGVERRFPAGERVIQAKDGQGRTLDVARVRLVSGAMHFYAPASDGYCFWFEHTHYGRAKSLENDIEPLAGPTHFWVLARRVDSWFSPNPPTADDHRSTGGSLTALRQGPCSVAPREDWSGPRE